MVKSNPLFSSLDLWPLGVMRRPILQGAIERRDADRQTPVRGKKEEVGNDSLRPAGCNALLYCAERGDRNITNTVYKNPHFKDYTRIHQSVQ